MLLAGVLRDDFTESIDRQNATRKGTRSLHNVDFCTCHWKLLIKHSKLNFEVESDSSIRQIVSAVMPNRIGNSVRKMHFLTFLYQTNLAMVVAEKLIS